jgi:hypothetical protein
MDIESALVTRAKAGDFAAFDTLVNRHDRRLCRSQYLLPGTPTLLFVFFCNIFRVWRSVLIDAVDVTDLESLCYGFC